MIGLKKFSNAQEFFYEKLFSKPSEIEDNDFKKFHQVFSRIIFQVLTNTYGLPAKIKSQVRKKMIAELVVQHITPFVDKSDKSRKASSLTLKALSAEAQARLIIGSKDFYLGLQYRLELAVNAYVTEETNAEDDRRCLIMLHDLKIRLNGALADETLVSICFVNDRLITAPAQIFWGMSSADNAIRQFLSQSLAIAARNKTYDGIDNVIVYLQTLLGCMDIGKVLMEEFLSAFNTQLSAFKKQFSADVLKSTGKPLEVTKDSLLRYH